MFKIDKYGGEWNLFKIIPITVSQLENVTKKHLPYFHKLLFGKVSECYWGRIVCGFLFGIIVGVVFYDIILVDLAFGKGTIYYLGIISTLLIAGGCAISYQVRCIILLTIPSFSGKSGRHIIIAIITSAILTGPVANITCNIEEIMRTYSCSNSLAQNLSQARYDLLVKPFKMAFLGTKLETDELKEMLGSVNNVVEPFAQEIEGVDDIKFIQEENDYMDEQLNDTKRSEELTNKYKTVMKVKREEGPGLDKLTESEDNITSEADAEVYQQQYFKKLETRCENVKTGMGQMCKKRFAKFLQQCEDAVHWAISWAICWPMKLDVICDLVKMFTYGGYDCDPSSDVSSGVGEGYVKLKNSEHTMEAGIADERPQYKIIKPPNLVGLYSAATITKEFVHDIHSKKTWAEGLFVFVKTILAFMFLLVILSASDYHNKFIQFTDHDNIYITNDFRVLDARRNKLKQPTLLPLTKAEKKGLADLYSLSLGSAETKELCNDMLVIFFMSLICAVVLGIDFFLGLALQWMHDNLEFSYQESGKHEFRIDVEGIGFVAAIVRSILKGFDFKKVLHGEVSNKVCLPQPKKLKSSDYFQLFGSFTFLFLMVYGDGYIKRLRRSICSFYYREQEKKRIETLYKKTLAFRQRLFKKQLETILKNAKKMEVQSDIRLCYKVYIKFAPWCNFLQIFPNARPICVVCEEVEPFFTCSHPKHKRCSTCLSYYCLECYTNFFFTCFICTAQKAINEKEKKDPDTTTPFEY